MNLEDKLDEAVAKPTERQARKALKRLVIATAVLVLVVLGLVIAL